MDSNREKALLKLEAEQMKCGFVDLVENPPVGKYARLIPRHVSEKYSVIIFDRINDNLKLAMKNPLDIFAIDEIQITTGLKVTPYLGAEKDIEDAIINAYGADETE